MKKPLWLFLGFAILAFLVHEAYAITPLEDEGGRGYTLEIVGTGLVYDNAQGYYNSSGNANSYLKNPAAVLINNTRLANGTFSMKWRITGNDYPDRKPGGFAMFSNTTQNHNIIYITLNTSLSAYGQIAQELRNRSNQNNYPGTAGRYRNQTSWVVSTWVFNYTNLIYYENGAVNTTTAIPGGVWNGPLTQMRFFESSGRNLNGSMDDIKFWNQTLTAAQVASAYAGDSVLPNDLVYWYTFSNTTADTSCTYSGTGNWNMPCGCNITTVLDMKGFNLTINTTLAGETITRINGTIGIAGTGLRNFTTLQIYGVGGTSTCSVYAWPGIL